MLIQAILRVQDVYPVGLRYLLLGHAVRACWKYQGG
jgi:hypothetical protein